MTIIEGDKNNISFSDKKVFDFLNNINSHEGLMPPEATEWWSNETEAKIKFKGFGQLHLKIDSVIPNSSIKIVPASPPPFDFSMVWLIKADGNNAIIQVVIEAELNIFMKLLAVGPLKELADFMASKVQSNMELQ